MPKKLSHKLLFFFVHRQGMIVVRRFEQRTAKAVETQARILLDKIRSNQDSDFGRAHGFRSIRSVEDFRKAMPIREYDYFKPYIARLKRGENHAMFGKGIKTVMFALTSGSTGEPKYIPITNRFIREYETASFLWGAYAYLDHKDFVEHRLLPVVSSMCERYTEAGIPCGAMSGLHAQKQKFFGRLLYAVPGCVFDIKDADSKYYAVMRCAIQEDVGLVSSPNPSTLIRIARDADEHKEQLARDVRDGTVDGSFDIPAQVREAIMRRFKKDPVRAREIEQIVSRTGNLYPKDFWPNMVLIGCWKSGSLTSFLPSLSKYYGDVPTRDLGLIASEGRMTIPIHDEPESCVLDVGSSFYEFIPEDQEDSENPDTLLCHELEVGKRYFIILTTSSGLYRYHIRDLVEVTGYHNSAPMLVFLSKGRRISSLTGEKITENQVVDAVNAAAREVGLRFERFTLGASWGELPYYSLFVEADDVSREKLGRFAAGVDRHLSRLNMEYESKRKSERLGAVVLKLVPNDTFEAVREEHIRTSGRPEQYKHAYLIPIPEETKHFQVLREIPPAE